MIGDSDHAVKGSMTYLPNAKGRAVTASAAIASVNTNADAIAVAAAPRVSLSPAPLVAAPVSNEIKIILPPPLPPMKTKKKRKKATSRNNPSTAMPPLPTTPATKKSKATTKKKKASESVDLRVMPIYVSANNLTKHCVVAIAHEQKWVAGVAATITGDVADEHTSIHQWCHKDPFGGTRGLTLVSSASFASTPTFFSNRLSMQTRGR